MKQVTRKILQIYVQSVQKSTFMLQLIYIRTFLVAHLVKNPPAMWETWVQSQGWEDTLEKGKATTPVSWPGEFMDSIVHGVSKLDMIE